MDESMTPSSLELVLPPPCKQCSGHTETSNRPQEHDYDRAHDVDPWRLPESKYQHEPRATHHLAPQFCFTPSAHPGQMKPPHPAGVWPQGFRKPVSLYERDVVVNHRSFASPSNYPQDRFVEEAESLEPPLSLKSDVIPCVPSRYPAAHLPGQCHCCINIWIFFHLAICY